MTHFTLIKRRQAYWDVQFLQCLHSFSLLHKKFSTKIKVKSKQKKNLRQSCPHCSAWRSWFRWSFVSSRSSFAWHVFYHQQDCGDVCCGGGGGRLSGRFICVVTYQFDDNQNIAGQDKCSRLIIVIIIITSSRMFILCSLSYSKPIQAKVLITYRSVWSPFWTVVVQ